MPTHFPPDFTSCFRVCFYGLRSMVVWFITVACLIFHHLFESFIQHVFSYSPLLPLLTNYLPFPYLPIQLCVLKYFFESTETNLCSLNILWVHGLSLEHCLITRNNNLRENSPSKQLTVANSFTTNAEISSFPSTSVPGFGVSWACTGFVCGVSITLNSYVQLNFCVQKALSPCSYP